MTSARMQVILFRVVGGGGGDDRSPSPQNPEVPERRREPWEVKVGTQPFPGPVYLQIHCSFFLAYCLLPLVGSVGRTCWFLHHGSLLGLGSFQPCLHHWSTE